MDRAYTVLLVERTKAVRRLTTRLLRRKGFDVLEVSDAAAALEVLAKDARHVDLVLIGAVGLELGQPGGEDSAADDNRVNYQIPQKRPEEEHIKYR